MSGIFKGIAKVFKKVVKAIIKIAPAALAVGALVFTGGAALGVSSMSGGWAGAAAKISSVLGATGTVGSALTGAITMAGQGALIGGGIAAVTGGDVMKGLRAGALGGAALGGVTGAMGGMGGAGGATTPGTIAGGGEGIPAPSGGAEAGLTQPVETSTAGGGTGGGLLSKVGGFVSKHPTIAGSVISGIGQGLIARGTSEAEMEALRERDRARAANYRGADPAAQFVSAAPGTSGMSPTERFDPRIYGSFEFVYNPKSGRIEKVPTGGRGG